jgi:hypothetical protein
VREGEKEGEDGVLTTGVAVGWAAIVHTIRRALHLDVSGVRRTLHLDVTGMYTAGCGVEILPQNIRCGVDLERGWIGGVGGGSVEGGVWCELSLAGHNASAGPNVTTAHSLREDCT